MIDGLSDTALLRIGIAAAALVLFLVILFTARKRSPQAGRVARDGDDAVAASLAGEARVEPTLSELIESGDDGAMGGAAVLAADGEPGDGPSTPPPPFHAERPLRPAAAPVRRRGRRARRSHPGDATGQGPVP